MIQTQSFTVTQPTRIQFGVGSINNLAKTIQEFNGSKVFLVIDPALNKTGITSQITAPLDNAGLPYVIYDTIDPKKQRL